MTAALLDDDELIDRIMAPYRAPDPAGLAHYEDVAELIRRYRASTRPYAQAYRQWEPRMAEASFQAPPATQVAPAPEKPVAAPLRGSAGHCHCGALLDDAGRCTAVTDWGEHREVPLTAAGVLELCQRVLDETARYEDVRTLAEWVLTRMEVEKP